MPLYIDCSPSPSRGIGAWAAETCHDFSDTLLKAQEPCMLAAPTRATGICRVEHLDAGRLRSPRG
jgi:hypothetical protein